MSGVGGDVRGTGKATILKPAVNINSVHVIPDTREGWGDAVRLVLESYVGNDALPGRFDYSQIRKKGSPIKGMGGTASGPDDLRELLEINIPGVLNPLEGLPITVTAIVDLFNFIGKCVVSGNVRRSAEIIFGEPDDQEFMSLKDPTKFGFELKDRRWVSNNSCFAEVGMDYSKTQGGTGEWPGYMWLDNARAFGRMADPPNHVDKKIVGMTHVASSHWSHSSYVIW